MFSFSNLMFAFFSRRFAEIKDCFSRVSTMIGVFGFGQIGTFSNCLFENMFSMGFIFGCVFSSSQQCQIKLFR